MIETEAKSKTKSRNWHAKSIGKLTGPPYTITVIGEVGSGIVAPTLKKNELIGGTKPGILYLTVESGTDNDQYTRVSYVETISSQNEYRKVHIDDANGHITEFDVTIIHS
ncbi:hypothetical protein SAMN05518672_102816 [Chitinophaga sp. CF118]|uniref:hypothetical protein n=1 Tax=Chitinophaga sp. CF118 TaxID=1884367 RepID=UPI0008E9EF2A|nr:hypothetical protein [Chitinophaga sp. CF118]SFD65626.1 hypothetical protein SAMN05518672_102816 [Chitinophaga sp. CF118]